MSDLICISPKEPQKSIFSLFATWHVKIPLLVFIWWNKTWYNAAINNYTLHVLVLSLFDCCFPSKPFTTFLASGELPITHATLYEYFFDLEQKKWVPWTKLVPKYKHAPEKKFNEILVPTLDTVRTTWILNLMVRIKRPVVLIGETGTSKTATIANFLRTLDQESHVSENSF